MGRIFIPGSISNNFIRILKVQTKGASCVKIWFCHTCARRIDIYTEFHLWDMQKMMLSVPCFRQVGVLQRISLSASKYSVSCQNPSCKYCSLKGGATWVVNWYNLSESLVDNKTTSSAFNEVFEIPL